MHPAGLLLCTNDPGWPWPTFLASLPCDVWWTWGSFYGFIILDGSFLGKPNIWIQPGDLKRSTIGRISSHLGLRNVQLWKIVTNKILLLLLLKILLPIVFSEIRCAVFFNRELFRYVLVPLCNNFLFVSLFCLPVTLLFLFLLALEQYFLS